MPTYTKLGDALRGDRIAINARRLSEITVEAGSGRHRRRSLTARDNVYCVIDKPLKAKPKAQAGSASSS